MIQQVCPNPVLLQQLYDGPLGAYVEAFAHQLLTQGYATSTAKYAMRLLADLTRWIEEQALRATDLNEERVEGFLQDRPYRGDSHRSDRSVLRQLLRQLREQGVIPASVVETGLCNDCFICRDFQDHLTHQRCLAPVSIKHYVEIIEGFLHDRIGTQPFQPETLQPQDITQFMLQQARRYSPARTQLMGTALRSFLRFLFQRGDIANDLAKAVPTMPNWRLSSLPKFMKAEDVDHLLQSCDRKTPKGQRDYAILLLLARLGLRAGEVVALTLDDLDWDAGELLIRGKGARQDRLPLPIEVGEALALYLRDSRPPSATRHVFIRMRAPRRGFRDHHAISTIVQRALSRAGLDPALKGAHLLRHSLATRLLQNGASLTEIGELLRHQHPDTTQIYAKVDQTALAQLALPWPGGEG